MDYAEYRIALPAPYRESMMNALMHAGALGAIEERSEIVVYFPIAVPRSLVMAHVEVFRELLARSGQETPIVVQEATVAHQDWNASWKRSFRPINIGSRFTVLPPWERPPAGRIPLIIDPGMAFGTGHHETTRSCLMLMERYASTVVQKRFLDLGTGTGLLAIAALKLGFRQVVAIDHDADAIASARLNLTLNDAADIDLRCGDISSAGHSYSMITANLISGTLIELAGEIANRLDRGGTAILSGILAGQENDVLMAMAQAGLAGVEHLPDGKWISLAMQQLV